ncbi:conserved hypothetical protein [Lodderomyces elongisporus NRRL YB-4239]|uniref:Signal recognition particle receptor subunit alpha homolog n=1 Tax=Lodderomyces elongisporus (strain ATCC 11503 / CBS 2605 / JCM 1781 / NBRC 1676 / NRRL YB-4239) TaxID=379508 RepID=A5E341_LODEL|nr:conserved hypothetical protein [Lodderomyces elongisporus NRRL YB-4239]
MSQCLIIFKSSGRVEYQSNNKIFPFNEFILSIVDETQNQLDQNFTTQTLNHKRFYCYHKEDVYVVLYIDAISTIDSEKIRLTLHGVYKTYNKYEEDDELNSEKFRKLIDLQFDMLMKLKQSQVGEENTATGSGTATPTKLNLGKQTPPPNTNTNTATTTTTKPTKTAKKKLRKWDDSGAMVETDAGADVNALDFSSSNDARDGVVGTLPEMKVNNEAAFVRNNEVVLVNELNEILNASDDDDENDGDSDVGGNGNGQKSGFFSKLSSYLGGSINLDEVSKKFYEQLISKNIAPGTAKAIIDKIKARLSGKKVTMTIFKQALTDELTKILTPNVSTDLLYEIKRNNTGRPYVISVVGVNGVGKSTNLAKLAYWFLQNNLNVLICACDTFRSGAVEQLKVHVNNLNQLNSGLSNKSQIDIYEKGYGGGDHVVTTAKQAIEYAKANAFDVVLIDTAGRTHSNAKLMAPLKKFGDAANPNKIIMVGEALVGTDSVEQATNFNQAFGNKRSLDFFIVSKVDTVGDLVGTMINMVMATKVPILFVGTGQTYTDIKRLSVKQVVEMLMK